jgi:hypothetical protein
MNRLDDAVDILHEIGGMAHSILTGTTKRARALSCGGPYVDSSLTMHLILAG